MSEPHLTAPLLHLRNDKMNFNIRITAIGCALIASLAFATAAAGQTISYPDAVLVDPIDPREGDRLGIVVKAHGEFVLAAAPPDQPAGDICTGSVFVYRQSSSGYQFVQRIAALQRGDCLQADTARRIEVCGDYLFIAAMAATMEVDAEGMVRVLQRTPNGYVPTQVISRPPGMEALELFGYMLRSDGERIYITSARREVGGQEMGAMFIYRNDGGTWVLDEWFENDAFTPNQFYPFRRGLAVEEGRIVVSTDFFSALLFEDGDSGWEWQSVFPRGANGYPFQMDIDDGRLIVGDANTAVGSFAGQPSYVQNFLWNGTEYELLGQIRPSVISQTGNVSDQFGYSVDIRGDELLVGARGRARNGLSSVGGAYLFKLENGAWVEKKLFLPDPTVPERRAQAGTSVAITDGAYLVGAEILETNGIWSGGVLVYERPFGEPLCDGVPNSTGAAAELELYGNSTAAAEALELRASGLPTDTFTLFATGQNTAQTPMLGGGQGTLCIAAQGIRRLGLTQADANGAASWQVDFGNLPGNPITGETYHFQTWYRDAAPGPTSNLTSAVSVTLK